MNKDNNITWLEQWHKDHAFDDGYALGIKIATLDNPGWIVEIDLAETEYEGIRMDRKKKIKSDDDWYDCRLEKDVFIGGGDCFKLDIIIGIFRKLVDDYSDVKRMSEGRIL